MEYGLRGELWELREDLFEHLDLSLEVGDALEKLDELVLGVLYHVSKYILLLNLPVLSQYPLGKSIPIDIPSSPQS